MHFQTAVPSDVPVQILEDPRREREDLTRVLRDWADGEGSALQRLMPKIYGDLRRLAQHAFDRERPGHTLQPTAIVHELYLRLSSQNRISWRNRGQFFAVAATMIRRLLVSHARKRGAVKRGGDAVVLSFDEVLGIPDRSLPELVALDEALRTLAGLSHRQSRVVELRYFGGLSIDETAEALEISPATVKLDWNLAKAWLFRELAEGTDGGA